MKLLGVVPLVCTAVPTFTDAPVETNVATRAVTSVPEGTVSATVFEDSVIVALAAGLVKLKVVRAFAVSVMGVVLIVKCIVIVSESPWGSLATICGLNTPVSPGPGVKVYVGAVAALAMESLLGCPDKSENV